MAATVCACLPAALAWVAISIVPPISMRVQCRRFSQDPGHSGQRFTPSSPPAAQLIPVPQEGEACFNAWNLNQRLGGGFGVVTRLIKNRLYYKYQVPSTT